MAFIEMNLMSESLMRTVQVNAILPIDKLQMPDQKDNANIKKKNFKTLYLLHGIFGSQVDWINGTKLQRWAEEKNIAVIMPAGENRFYLDYPAMHEYYGKFIGEELVQLTRDMFPLSREKKDTFIGGLSMGGYGAVRNGLKYYENFGGIAGLSVGDLLTDPTVGIELFGIEFLEAAFGNFDEARSSDKSLSYLIEQNTKDKKTDQRIYIGCGKDDGLLKVNRDLKDLFIENGYDVTYSETEGAHEWDFWNDQIKKVIDWIEPYTIEQGINSGNIK
ncbi:MAG: acetylesterase [Solobacterium sp.]|nr:acetylesterase [Solobacterium sp.]